MQQARPKAKLLSDTESEDGTWLGISLDLIQKVPTRSILALFGKFCKFRFHAPYFEDGELKKHILQGISMNRGGVWGLIRGWKDQT